MKMKLAGHFSKDNAFSRVTRRKIEPNQSTKLTRIQLSSVIAFHELGMDGSHISLNNFTSSLVVPFN